MKDTPRSFYPLRFDVLCALVLLVIFAASNAAPAAAGFQPKAAARQSVSMEKTEKPRVRLDAPAAGNLPAKIGEATLSSIAAANGITSTYTITTVSTIMPLSFRPVSLNGSGQVAFNGYDNTFQSQATIYDHGVSTFLDTLHVFVATRPEDISDSGYVVGQAYPTNGGERGFFYDGSTMTVIRGLDEDDEAHALGVNDSGIVVGFVTPHPDQLYLRRPFRWENGTTTELPSAQPCFGGCETTPWAINNQGVIVGGNRLADCDDPVSCGNNSVKAVKWTNGAVSLLDTSPRREGAIVRDSIAFDINNQNIAVGYRTVIINGTAYEHAWLWGENYETDLMAGMEKSGSALGINDKGQVVGSIIEGLYGRGFLWENGVLTDLNTLIPADSGFEIGAGYEINDAGEIAANDPHNQMLFFLYHYDSDGDALPDEWERKGVTRDGVLVDLPKMGADPLHKDVFIHLDHMESYPASLGVLKTIREVFEDAPVDNPDGTTGIRLHIDGGGNTIMNPVTDETWGNLSRAAVLPDADSTLECNSYAVNGECKNYDWDEADMKYKGNYHAAKRDNIFYYACICTVLEATTNPKTSGVARDHPSAEFYVTLANFDPPGGTTNMQVGTFIHELGHSLGLDHGGLDGVNYKPNYLSVMNYNFQFAGLQLLGSLERTFDLSRSALPTLNESALDEAVGIGDPEFHKTIFSRSGITDCYADPYFYRRLPTPALDWNCNGVKDQNVIRDINGDTHLSQLKSYDDWSNIKFGGGGAIGKLGAAVPTAEEIQPEATVEDMLRILPQDDLAEIVTKPVALFIADTTTGNAPLTVNVDATAAFSPNGDISAYNWNFGDGATGSGKLTSHTFTVPGTYEIHLTVTDTANKTNGVDLPITIQVNGGNACVTKPQKPLLTAPVNKAKNQPTRVQLTWDAPCANQFQVVVKQDNKKGAVIVKKNVTGTGYKTKALVRGKTYVWQVKACNAIGCTKSKWASFTIKP